MTVPLWVSILIAVIAGMSGGIVGPFVTDRLQRSRWKAQKAFDLKYDAFQGAIDAVAAWEADALDIALQKQKPVYKDSTPVVAKRETTVQALAHHECLIDALFSDSVSQKYRKLMRSHISFENVPNIDFEDNRKAFVAACALELGLSGRANAA